MGVQNRIHDRSPHFSKCGGYKQANVSRGLLNTLPIFINVTTRQQISAWSDLRPLTYSRVCFEIMQGISNHIDDSFTYLEESAAEMTGSN